MKIFDSHTHLNDDMLYKDVTSYFNHAQKLGVKKIANVGSNQKLNERSIELAEQHPDMYAIIGWHPEDSIYFKEDQEQWLIDQLTNPKVIAIGEIGLDYYQTNAPRSIQKAVFKRQLEIAKEYHLPVSIHNRDAFEDTYEILKRSWRK
ncbi:putative deoxyribonuclease YcfH [Lentilactobacillus kosonis]|uniref:Putative deoxyribonuclease YcfH n=1 Tax=Lentilactobacillus kosonis TaxID=2810561 RepID=A0A401FPC7_9LACO|nr:putative deoxyribonuclease YcfH [Lentilactobacillus kosonis]